MRSDRLTELIKILRGGGRHRAADLARKLGVTMRTIYRDMDRLRETGVPVEGTRGSGYSVRNELTLPPMNLSRDELEALHLGLAVLSEAGDARLADAATRLSARVDAALPEDGADAPAIWGAATLPFADAARGFRALPQIRDAIRARQKLALQMPDTRHILHPHSLDYWGRVWTVTGWSETAAAQVELRLDQAQGLSVLPELFTRAGNSLSGTRSSGRDAS